MYLKGTESWKIVMGSDLPLNFAIYTGCLYGFIDDVNGIDNCKLWPPKCWDVKLNDSLFLLKEQWNNWFNSMINHKGNKIITNQELYSMDDPFEPHYFFKIQYSELREYCEKAWPSFIEWWNMVGGGRNALAFLEGIDNTRIYRYIDEFENIVQRKTKSFNLYIDLVYTGTSKIIEVNSEYIIMVPVSAIYSDKNWWMAKLHQVG